MASLPAESGRETAAPSDHPWREGGSGDPPSGETSRRVGGRTSWFARDALLPDGPARNVRFEIAGGRFRSIRADARPGRAQRLPGVVLPGFANAHSHAFHRALRGRTHADGGTFWTWRERMYALAGRLDPDIYLALARATYAEMALAGITTVGEFHYLHHDRDGRPYAERNVMGKALREAAMDAGIRITLLDACYLAGGLDGTGYLPLDPVQRRFADRDGDAWLQRVEARRGSPDHCRLGVAIHSVRAVPLEAMRIVANHSRLAGEPLHVHLSEQPAENEATRAYFDCTPTDLLGDAGGLGPLTTAVHATHLRARDQQMLARQQVTVCMCPTTERDLADGIGPARQLAGQRVRLSLGSDQHAVIDMFEEARGLEMDERLDSGQRGRFAPNQLLRAMTAHTSLGWNDTGQLLRGLRADLVAVRTDTVRTAGATPEQLLYAATAADVDTVLVDGRPVVQGGQHRLGDVGRMLGEAIEAAWQQF